jgi:hypothetical protein
MLCVALCADVPSAFNESVVSECGHLFLSEVLLLDQILSLCWFVGRSNPFFASYFLFPRFHSLLVCTDAHSHNASFPATAHRSLVLVTFRFQHIFIALVALGFAAVVIVPVDFVVADNPNATMVIRVRTSLDCAFPLGA